MPSVKNSVPDADEALATQIHATAIHLLRHARKTDQMVGIGPAQLSALSVLVYGGPQTVSALADIEQVKRPTMSRTVSYLEDSGYVRKLAGQTDGRSFVVKVTRKGEAILERARAQRIDTLCRMLATLSTRDKSHLRMATAILDTALSETDNPS